MANLQTYYVDLSLDNAIQGSGTKEDKYSWGDVKRLFDTLNQAPMDTGNNTDSSVSFDATSMSMEFRLSGRKTLSASDIITVSNIEFFLNALIRFTSDDPASNGVPVITVPSSMTANHVFGMSNCISADLRIHNILFDIQGTLTSIVQTSGSMGGVLFENNIALLTTKANLVSSNNTDSYVAVAGNTTVIGPAITGTIKLVYVTGSNTALAISHNLTAQHSSSGVAVVGVESTQGQCVVSSSGNVWAINTNGAPYTGNYPTSGTGSPDIFGQALTSVIYGDSTMGATGTPILSLLSSDTDMSRGASEFTLGALRPKHTGLALATVAGTNSVVTLNGLPLGNSDTLGNVRQGALDAGALQKSDVTADHDIFVNLELAATRTNNIGTESDPVSVTDMILDLIRRAPVDNTVTYNVMGTMLNPLPFALGDGASYVGDGEIRIRGWKTYNHPLPVLKTDRITLNQALDATLDRVFIEWTGTEDLISNVSGGASSNENIFKFVNSAVRSSNTNTGRLVALLVNGPLFYMGGISGVLRHTSSTSASSGYIALDANIPHILALSAFEMANQPKLITTPDQTSIRGIYASRPGGDAASITGTDDVQLCVLDGTPPFTSSAATVPDLNLLENSTAVGLVDDLARIPVELRSEILTDCRDLERAAYPYGTASLDAGAYESGYKVYPETHVYADLSKTTTGHVGTILDKFSHPDLQSWLSGLKSSVLTRKYVVHLSRRLETSGPVLDLSNMEGNPYASGITFVSDNGKKIATLVANRGPVVEAVNVAGLNVSLDKTLLASTSGYGPILLTGSDTTTINRIQTTNEILSWVHTNAGFYVKRTGTVGPSSTITVNTTTFTMEDTGNPAEDFKNLLKSIQAHSVVGPMLVVTEVIPGLWYRIYQTTTTDISVNSATGITTTRANALVEADGTWECRIGATSITDTYTRDLNLQTNVFSGSTNIDLIATVIDGTSSGSNSGIGAIASGLNDVQGLAYYPSTTTVPSPTGDHVEGIRAATAHLLSNPDTQDFDLEDYRIAGNNEAVGILQGSHIPTWASSINVDTVDTLRFIDTAGVMDAGALEYAGVTSEGAYDSATVGPRVNRTTAGQAMHMRAETEGPLSLLNPWTVTSTGKTRTGYTPFAYKIVGYQLLNAGYVYWQPTRPSDIANFSGSQATASITVTGNLASGSAITITYLGKTLTLSYPGSFTHADVSATEIATMLREAFVDDVPFESIAWIAVSGQTVTITAKLLGIYGNTITVAASGAGLLVANTDSSNNITGGVSPSVPATLVYPDSGYIPFDKTELPDPYSLSFMLKLGVGQMNKAFGAIVVVAQITGSPLADEVGKTFPYAIVTMPLESKHERKTISCRVLFT